MMYQYEKKMIFGNVNGGPIIQAMWTCCTLIIFSVSVLTI